MRNMLKGALLVAALFLAGYTLSYGQARFGISFDDGKLTSLGFVVGPDDIVPPGNVAWVREAGIPEDEIPVVFFISRHTGWGPRAIIRMRLEGLNWWDISDRCGLGPGYYRYADRGPGYDRDYGRWHYDRPYWGGYGHSGRDYFRGERGRFDRDFHGGGRHEDRGWGRGRERDRDR